MTQTLLLTHVDAHPLDVFLLELVQSIIKHLSPLALVFLPGDVVSRLHLTGALAVVTPRPLLLELLGSRRLCFLDSTIFALSTRHARHACSVEVTMPVEFKRLLLAVDIAGMYPCRDDAAYNWNSISNRRRRLVPCQERCLIMLHSCCQHQTCQTGMHSISMMLRRNNTLLSAPATRGILSGYATHA